MHPAVVGDYGNRVGCAHLVALAAQLVGVYGRVVHTRRTREVALRLWAAGERPCEHIRRGRWLTGAATSRLRR
eukprot:2510538-Prymnesium_polylepis.2